MCIIFCSSEISCLRLASLLVKAHFSSVILTGTKRTIDSTHMVGLDVLNKRIYINYLPMYVMQLRICPWVKFKQLLNVQVSSNACAHAWTQICTNNLVYPVSLLNRSDALSLSRTFLKCAIQCVPFVTSNYSKNNHTTIRYTYANNIFSLIKFAAEKEFVIDDRFCIVVSHRSRMYLNLNVALLLCFCL